MIGNKAEFWIPKETVVILQSLKKQRWSQIMRFRPNKNKNNNNNNNIAILFHNPNLNQLMISKSNPIRASQLCGVIYKPLNEIDLFPNCIHKVEFRSFKKLTFEVRAEERADKGRQVGRVGDNREM